MNYRLTPCQNNGSMMQYWNMMRQQNGDVKLTPYKEILSQIVVSLQNQIMNLHPVKTLDQKLWNVTSMDLLPVETSNQVRHNKFKHELNLHSVEILNGKHQWDMMRLQMIHQRLTHCQIIRLRMCLWDNSELGKDEFQTYSLSNQFVKNSLIIHKLTKDALYTYHLQRF